MTDKKDISFIVYGRSWCSWCKKAKELLNHKMFSFVYNDMDQMNIQDCINIKEKTGQQTIPIIFAVEDGSEKFIGGYNDLKEYIGVTI